MQGAPLLSGPSLSPASGKPPTALVVLLHGYGANGEDLIGLAPFFARLLPDAEFVAPDAPERCGMGFGYQWFPIGTLDPIEMARGAAAARASLDAFLDRALMVRGLGPERLALVGFSQGTMMALDRAGRRPDGARAVAGFSGMIPGRFGPVPPGARPPILLVHGTADPVVPFERLTETEAALLDAGFPVETLVRPGLGHTIDPDGALHASRFLARHLARDAGEGIRPAKG
jgi:phospholipase/carboxylesterase